MIPDRNLDLYKGVKKLKVWVNIKYISSLKEINLNDNSLNKDSMLWD